MQSSEPTMQLELTARLQKPIPLLPPALLLLLQPLLVEDGYVHLSLVSYLEAKAATHAVFSHLLLPCPVLISC